MEREWNGSLHGTYPPDDHKIISSGSFSIKQVLCVSYILLLAHFHRSWVPQGPLWSLLSLRQQPVLQVLRQLFNRQQDPSGHFDDYYVKLPVHLQLLENDYPKPQYKLPHFIRRLHQSFRIYHLAASEPMVLEYFFFFHYLLKLVSEDGYWTVRRRKVANKCNLRKQIVEPYDRGYNIQHHSLQ